MLNALSMSAETLASFLTQSPDCVKLLDPGGNVVWMNANGLCVMEVDAFEAIRGKPWSALWPESAKEKIEAGCRDAVDGTHQHFVAACPTARGTPKWWDVTISRVTDPAGDHAGFLAVSRDITEAVLAAEARDVAAQEMRHRLRNSYAVVGSLITGLARGNSTYEEFARQISQRLHAMGSAQSLFAEHEGDVDLGELIRILTHPFDTPACQLAVHVPSGLRVSQQVADAIALVVGELAVNSSKHGAITHGGIVEVNVQTSAQNFTAIWNERSRRQIARTTRPGGQGLDLIRRIVAARRGTVDTEWYGDGLSTSVTLPLLRAATGPATPSASVDLSREAALSAS